MLERIGIGFLAPSDLDPYPGDQAAVLGDARRGVARLLGRQILHPAERLEADRVGLDDSRRDDREGIDELRIGGRVLRETPVARRRRGAAVAHQRPEIARAIVSPEGHRQDAGRDELAEPALEPGALMGRHQESPGAAAQLLLVVGEDIRRHRLGADARRKRARGREREIIPEGGTGSAEIAGFDASPGKEADEDRCNGGGGRAEGTRRSRVRRLTNGGGAGRLSSARSIRAKARGSSRRTAHIGHR